ncbi:hypothetical protein FACS189418_7810 [Clostridia bacterium]|nr:hypothetical protein FACS189418_7810 [Clostridia bacterium]
MFILSVNVRLNILYLKGKFNKNQTKDRKRNNFPYAVSIKKALQNNILTMIDTHTIFFIQIHKNP